MLVLVASNYPWGQHTTLRELTGNFHVRASTVRNKVVVVALPPCI